MSPVAVLVILTSTLVLAVVAATAAEHRWGEDLAAVVLAGVVVLPFGFLVLSPVLPTL
jgi:hypothetical protein